MMELSIEDYYNVSRKKIITISILDGVTCIKRNEFGGCSNLISIDIPTSVESIGSGAFYGCESLTSINIPPSVITISPGAFCGCDNLNDTTKSEILRSFGDKVFYW